MEETLDQTKGHPERLWILRVGALDDSCHTPLWQVAPVTPGGDGYTPHFLCELTPAIQGGVDVADSLSCFRSPQVPPYEREFSY